MPRTRKEPVIVVVTPFDQLKEARRFLKEAVKLVNLASSQLTDDFVKSLLSTDIQNIDITNNSIRETQKSLVELD